MDSKHGVAAMVQFALQFENELGLEITHLAEAEGFNCLLEAAGKHLSYVVSLKGSELWLRSQLLHSGAEPIALLKTQDDQGGWLLVHRIVFGMEREQIKSLALPIELGPLNEEGFVIA